MISCNCWILSKHYSGVNSALFGTIFSCRIIHIWCCSEFKNTQKTNLQYIRSLLNRWHLFERSINCCYCVFFMPFCWQIEHIEDYKLDILIQQWHRRDYLYSCVLTVFFFFHVCCSHENSSGYYRTSVYFLSKIFGDLVPNRIIPIFVFSAIAYYMMGNSHTQRDVSKRTISTELLQRI